MPTRLRVLGAGCLLLLAAGCATPPPRTAPQAAPPTPIARLNTTSLVIPRINFCGLVPKSAVTAAVGSKDWKVASYGNGDQAPVTSSGSDVAAEHLCVWQAATGTESARAWVFARSVDRQLAEAVVRGEKRPGCTTPPGPSFGDPTVTQKCRIEGGTRVRHEGLIGDTWLGCEVSGPDGRMKQTRTRADAWCVGIANALNTSH